MTVFDMGAHDVWGRGEPAPFIKLLGQEVKLPAPLPPPIDLRALFEEPPMLAGDILARMVEVKKRLEEAAVPTYRGRTATQALLEQQQLELERMLRHKLSPPTATPFGTVERGFHTRDVAVMRAMIERITYKPGTQLSVYEDSHGRACLQVTQTVLDVNPPHRRTEVHLTRPIEFGRCFTEDGFLTFVRDALQAMEAHEADEWFKVDGKAPFDPHRFGD